MNFNENEREYEWCVYRRISTFLICSYDASKRIACKYNTKKNVDCCEPNCVIRIPVLQPFAKIRQASVLTTSISLDVLARASLRRSSVP